MPKNSNKDISTGTIDAENEAAADKIISRQSVLDAVMELDPMNNSKYKAANGITAAKIFRKVFHDVVRYVVEDHCWYVYDGKRWKPDGKDTQSPTVNGLAIILVEALQTYVKQKIADKGTDNLTPAEKDFIKFTEKLTSHNARKNMIEDAKAKADKKSNVCISVKELDRDTMLFNVDNGTLNLQTFKLQDHNPNDLITMCADVRYDPDAPTDTWSKLLSGYDDENGKHHVGNFEGEPEKAAYLQTLLGLSLTGITREKQCYFITGKPNTGKSTLLNAYGDMLGDYAKTTKAEAVAQQKRNSQSPDPDRIALRKIRYMQVNELMKGLILDVAFMKTLTGVSDKVTARPMFGDEQTFRPRCKAFLICNELPTINDMSLFTSDRAKVITFDHVFDPDDDTTDRYLDEKLRTPENLSGLLNWCLIGLRAYSDDGLETPQCVTDDTNRYAENSDKIQMFIDDCLEKKDGTAVTCKEVYDAYKEYCHDSGCGCEKKSNFNRLIVNYLPVQNTGTIDGNTYHNVIAGYQLNGEAVTMNDYGA